MAFEMRMERLSQGSDYGVVSKWLKREGDSVQLGEPLVEVEVEKALVTLNAPVTGVLSKIAVEVDDEVAVDGLLAVFDQLEPA